MPQILTARQRLTQLLETGLRILGDVPSGFMGHDLPPGIGQQQRDLPVFPQQLLDQSDAVDRTRGAGYADNNFLHRPLCNMASKSV